MDATTSSLATTDEVSQFNEEQADEKDEVLKKLDLPPEYDENDSRWTLKHPTPAEGLVELMKDSGVFVNAEKLAECKSLSNNSNNLAQLLLTEVFTVSALRTCSWPGANVNATDNDGGHTTPQLDEHAANILLEFVKEYAQLHEWELEDFLCIVKHLRRIMLDMRHKRDGETEILVLPPVDRNLDLLPAKSQNHSRWTLKYPEPAEGVVELVENTGVYVNADKLAFCMKWSNNCVALASKLLKEIFTARALSTCSLPVITALSIVPTDETETERPVLDEDALSTLLLFVVQYAHDKNWILKGDEQTCIQESIHQSMNFMRKGKKVFTPQY